MKTNSVVDFAWVTAGVIITALGLDMFLIPNKIAAGGVSGAATVVHYIIGLPVGITMLFMNIPLFIMGISRLGLTFGFRSLYGTVSLSVAIDLLNRFLPVPTEDSLLAALYGGVMVGLGLGLVFRYRGTTGGTDLAAALIRSYKGINIGQALFMVDALVVISAGLTFHSWELAMYALITIFISAWMIDLVQEGISYAKAFFIISDKQEAVVNALFNNMDRGVTALKGKGLYTQTDREVLFIVVTRSEVSTLKNVVYNVDPAAFVILTDVREVLGEGFKYYGNQ